MDLDTFLRERNMSEAQFGKLAETTGATINRIRRRRMVPSAELALRIEQSSGGAVSASDLSPTVARARA
jgi:hypothetical protein